MRVGRRTRYKADRAAAAAAAAAAVVGAQRLRRLLYNTPRGQVLLYLSVFYRYSR